jgi:hypothetical protein
MKKLFCIAFIVFFVSGCGYKPTTTYTKGVLDDNIYATVQVLRSDPARSVEVQDAINEAIITRFGANLVAKEYAETFITVQYNSLSFHPLQYDEDGYVVYYEAVVSLSVDYQTQTQKDKFSVSGTYEFPIESNAVLTDAKRSEALKNGALNAIDAFISRLALKGINRDNPNNNQK